jgi:hypothetical protein
MKDLLKVIENFQIENVTHDVNTKEGKTFLTIYTNYGTSSLNTIKTSTADLEYVINSLDPDEIDVETLIEQMEVKKSLRWSIFNYIKNNLKDIKEVNNDW